MINKRLRHRVIVMRLPMLLLLSLAIPCLGQTITSVAPLVLAISDTVTVRGTGFTCASASTAARVGTYSVSGSTLQVSSSSLLLFKMPSAIGTLLDVTVTLTCGGITRSATSPLSQRVSYRNTISSIFPRVSAAGGAVTVIGQNFVMPCTAKVGTISSGNCNFISATSVVVTVPNYGGSSGFFFDFVVVSNGLSATLASSFSYPPSLSSLQPSVINPNANTVVTVLGSNFPSGTCVSASLVVNAAVINAAECFVSTATSLRIRFPTFAFLGNSSFMTLPLAARINSVDVSRNFIFLLQPSTPASVTPASASGSTAVTAAVIGGSVAVVVLIVLCVCAKRLGWCCFKNASQIARQPEASYSAPNSFAYAPNAPHFTMPSAPRANTVEVEMASAPPSDSVERQWGQYMAAYDVRQQEHMGGAMPPRYDNYPQATAPPSATVVRDDWSGYMDAYHAQLPSHMGPAAYDSPSAPPVGSAVILNNRQC